MLINKNKLKLLRKDLSGNVNVHSSLFLNKPMYPQDEVIVFFKKEGLRNIIENTNWHRIVSEGLL